MAIWMGRTARKRIQTLSLLEKTVNLVHLLNACIHPSVRFHDSIDFFSEILLVGGILRYVK